MSSMANFLSYLKDKLGDSSFVTDSDNIIFNESTNISARKDADFPRLEILLGKLKCNGYVSQRNMEWALRFGIAGYIRIDEEGTDADEFDVSVADMKSIVNFGVETLNLVYQLLDDKQTGDFVSTGFEKFGEYPEVYIDVELFPKTNTFTLLTEAHFHVTDTEDL